MSKPEAQAGTGGGAIEGEGESKLRPSSAVDAKDGYWPSWWRKYLNDWRTAKNAKANDGLSAPKPADPDWIDLPGATTEIVLEAARERHGHAEDRIKTAEGRATRLVQTALSLLTLSIIAGGFGISRLKSLESLPAAWMIALFVAAVSILFLALATVQALGVDRVGYVHPPEPGPAAAQADPEEQRRNLTRQEMRAAYMANWTARHKVNEVLQARAWLTRGVTTLLVSALIAGAVWVLPEDSESQDSKTTTTTATTLSVP